VVVVAVVAVVVATLVPEAVQRGWTPDEDVTTRNLQNLKTQN